MSEQEINTLKSVLQVFIKKRQILEYAQIVRQVYVTSNYRTPSSRDDLVKAITRKFSGVERKIKDLDLRTGSDAIDMFIQKGFIKEYEGYLFFTENFIGIRKITGQEPDNQNYYHKWSLIDDIPWLNAEADTGKTDTGKRVQIEASFRELNGQCNVIVATPALELGIDIGDLDVVGILYAPPSTANYTQRVGRAGRKGKSALSVVFLADRSLDGMYFDNPYLLVKGFVTPPRFDITLQEPNRKSVYSMFLYLLFKSGGMKISSLLDVSFWLTQFSLIKKYVDDVKEKLRTPMEEFIRVTSYQDTYDNMVKQWLETIEKQITVESSVRNNTSVFDRDIFPFLKRAGLLPDYAFGNSGAILLVRGGYDKGGVTGFALDEICPPSNLDHDKKRFKSESISLNPAHIRRIADNATYSCSCGFIVNLTESEVKCAFCSSKITDKDESGLAEPKVVWGRRSTFSLHKKRVKWRSSLFNFTEEVTYVTSYSSVPYNGKILQRFDGVYDNYSRYEVCGKQNCGFVYSDKREGGCKNHEKYDSVISRVFPTRFVILNLSTLTEFHDVDDVTLLNALLSAITIEAGCEEGEVDGFAPTPNKMVIFDNVDGGVGFVDVINEKFNQVVIKARELCEKECCDTGCVRCIGSFWRQHELDALNKKKHYSCA